MENLMTCGEFAKLCHVSKRVLFYYDEINLLKPAYVNEKGYRYYAWYQYDQMGTIQLFQNIGMSLKDIQALIDQKDFLKKSAELQRQYQIVENKIKEFENIKKNLLFLNQRFSILQQYGFLNLFEENIEDEYYIREKRPEGKFFFGYMNYGYQYGIIFERDCFDDFKWTFKRCEKQEANYIKPKGRYYAAFFLLRNEDLSTCIPEFLKMIDYSKTIGPLYHEDYCSEIAGYEQKYVIKLSILKKV